MVRRHAKINTRQRAMLSVYLKRCRITQSSNTEQHPAAFSNCFSIVNKTVMTRLVPWTAASRSAPRSGKSLMFSEHPTWNGAGSLGCPSPAWMKEYAKTIHVSKMYLKEDLSQTTPSCRTSAAARQRRRRPWSSVTVFFCQAGVWRPQAWKPRWRNRPYHKKLEATFATSS